MLYHCRMRCYAIGIEAVVLRSWCVTLRTVCPLVFNCIYVFCVDLRTNSHYFPIQH